MLWIHPAAEDEFERAAAFYVRQSPRLAAEFVLEVEDAFTRIRELPLAGSPEDAGVRRHYSKRFPFTIFYEVDEARIAVYAIAHQRRRPGYWSHRRSSGAPT